MYDNFDILKTVVRVVNNMLFGRRKKNRLKEYEEEKQSAFAEIVEQSVIVILKMKEMLDKISEKFLDNGLLSSMENLHSEVSSGFVQLSEKQKEQEEQLLKILSELNGLKENLAAFVSGFSERLGNFLEKFEMSLQAVVEKVSEMQRKIEFVEKLVEKAQQQSKRMLKNVYPL